MKKKKNPFEGPALFSNNSRRIHGLRPHRKTNRKKRYFTRCEPMETIEAFLNYCDYTKL